MKALCARAALATTCVLALSLLPGLPGLRAQSPAATPARTLVGEWTFNADLSDKPHDRTEDRGEGSGGRRAGGGGGRRGGYGGGFGGGRYGSGGGGSTMSAEDRQRLRDEMREIMNPPDRLTITEGDSMVIVTSGDGHVDRLSPNGKKIKDESTGIERKTKWDGDKLVSEITGAGSRKITQTYSVDPEHKQLHVVVQVETPGQPTKVNRVYDAATARG
jgi:hypothetical protein